MVSVKPKVPAADAGAGATLFADCRCRNMCSARFRGFFSAPAAALGAVLRAPGEYAEAAPDDCPGEPLADDTRPGFAAEDAAPVRSDAAAARAELILPLTEEVPLPLDDRAAAPAPFAAPAANAAARHETGRVAAALAAPVPARLPAEAEGGGPPRFPCVGFLASEGVLLASPAGVVAVIFLPATSVADSGRLARRRAERFPSAAERLAADAEAAAPMRCCVGVNGSADLLPPADLPPAAAAAGFASPRAELTREFAREVVPPLPPSLP
jgi:hypothetical protein